MHVAFSNNILNWIFQLYAQKGATFNTLLATDITPLEDAWQFTDSTNAGHFTAAHAVQTPLTFTGVATLVNLPAELCQMGVDHVILGVIDNRTQSPRDCILYNNYVAHPVVCSSDPGKFSSRHLSHIQPSTHLSAHPPFLQLAHPSTHPPFC